MKISSKSNEGRHEITIRMIESNRDEIRIKINEDTATVFYTTMENALRGIEEIKLRFPECAHYEIYEGQQR